MKPAVAGFPSYMNMNFILVIEMMGQDYSEMVIMLFKTVFLILSSYMLYQIFLDRFSLLSKVSCCVQNGKGMSDGNRAGDSGVS